MRDYYVSLGRRGDYPHPAPERTAYKVGTGAFSDDRYHIWPSRAAMLQACKMGDGRTWHALVKEPHPAFCVCGPWTCGWHERRT